MYALHKPFYRLALFGYDHTFARAFYVRPHYPATSSQYSQLEPKSTFMSLSSSKEYDLE